MVTNKQPLIADGNGKPFYEFGPPYDPDHQTIPCSRLNAKMTPKNQWICFGLIWAVLLFWLPTYYLDVFECDNVENWNFDHWNGVMCQVNSVFPVLILFVFAYPMGYGLLGWTPPQVGFIMFALNLILPVACSYFQVLIPYFCGLSGSIIIAFAWLSIHGSEMTNAPWNKNTWWGWVVGVPALLGLMNAGMYWWQYRANPHFRISPQLRFIVEGTVFFHYMLDVIILFVKEALNKNKFDSDEFRIYNLNDVQYIRLNTMRVCLFITGYYGMARGLEYLVFFELDKYKADWCSTHSNMTARWYNEQNNVISPWNTTMTC